MVGIDRSRRWNEGGAIAALALVLALAATPAAAEETAIAAADPADDIIVTGRAQKLYRASKATVGKVPADPLDIAQSVQVIPTQLIEDQGARDITDLYRNVSGISFFSYSGVTFRGFRQDDAFYDGLRGNPFTGFSVPQLFNIERVEFLKGPAGMLYGPGSPGGTINYVTKKPGDTFSANLRGIVGNYSRYGGSADVTGPLTDGISARAGLFFEDYNSFRIGAESRTLIADGGLKFRLAEGTELVVQATHYDQNLPGNRLRGVQVDEDGNFLTSIRWNHNEPTDFLKLDAQVFQARIDSRLSDAISVNVAARYFEYDEAQNYHEQRGLVDSDSDGVFDAVQREFRDQVRGTDSISLGGNLIAKASLGGTEHTILFGGDWAQQDSLSLSRTARPVAVAGGVVPNLPLFDPVYGLTSGALYNLAATPYTRSLSRSTRYGIYLQDQIAIGDRFILSGGIRKDWFEDDNRLNAVDFSDSDITLRFGAIFKPRQDVSIYASWSDTFEPQSAGSQIADVGGPFAPVTGEQIEGGIKTALLDGRVQANAAVYRIKRQNILQVDTSLPPVNGRDQLRPIGEVTSKGFEFDLATDITPDWVLTFNYGYNDTKITGTAPGQSITNAVGDRFVNAPKHKLGFWTRYQVEAIRTAFAFGGEYVSARVGFDDERVKPYTIFDGSITTDLEFVEVMLRVENIFDKRYAASGFGLRNGSFPGDPRTVFVELRKKF
jgi:iron complex outermembrane receptor protein